MTYLVILRIRLQGATSKFHHRINIFIQRQDLSIYFPIANTDIPRFQLFRHFTSLDSAFSILVQRKIFGDDTGRHGNFTIKDHPQKDITKSTEVTLVFKFLGPQIACFTTDFDVSRFALGGRTIAGHAFHFFVQDAGSVVPGTDMVDAHGLARRSDYWQTNIYPGTENLLELQSVSINVERPQLPIAMRMFTGRCVKDFNGSLHRYDRLSRQIAQIDALAMSRNGETFSIPSYSA